MSVANSEFTFIPETHTYLDENGQTIPSVTQIMNAVGIVNYDGIPESVLEHKAEIGTAAHAASHFFDEGDLNWNTVDAEVAPYVHGWVKFREETGFTPRLIEQRGIAKLRGMSYGYTLDREGLLHGRETLIEVKCTAGVEVSWGPQTAAYELALRAQDGKARQRVAVHLQKNGTYVLIPLGDIADYKIFEWALGIESWKKLKGKVNKYGYGSTHITR